VEGALTISPEQLAKSGSEDGHQLAIMQWCALNIQTYPDLKWLYHCPNGGSRHKAEAVKLKALGVKPGVPDLHLPVKRGRYSGLIIELKKLKGGVVSEEQKDWLHHLNSQGFCAVVCRGWEEAVNCIKLYLNGEKWKTELERI
jgi:hypothetical protein